MKFNKITLYMIIQCNLNKDIHYVIIKLTFKITCFNNVMIKSLSVVRSWISSNIIWEKFFNAGSCFINCSNIPVVQNNILPCSRDEIL